MQGKIPKAVVKHAQAPSSPSQDAALQSVGLVLHGFLCQPNGFLVIVGRQWGNQYGGFWSPMEARRGREDGNGVRR